MDVLPKQSEANTPNSHWCHAVRACQVFVAVTGIVFGADTAHLVGREFSSSMSLASCFCSVPFSVGAVGTACVPPEVCEGVVSTIAVSVTALLPIGAGADKSLKDKPVDVALPSPRSEHHQTVAVFLDALAHSPPGISKGATTTQAAVFGNAIPLAPHRPVVADAIAVKSNDVAVLNDRLDIRHASLQERSVCLGAAVK